MKTLFACLLFVAVVGQALAAAQAEDFSYQGRLELNGQPASGTFPMTFTLFDAQSGGNQVGAPDVHSNVNVSGGGFGVLLSFPGAFTGTQLWLEVTVDGQVITPRHKVAAAPVAQFALNGARLLDYSEPNPSTGGTVPSIYMNSAGPFDLYGECTLDLNTGAVSVNPLIFSNDNFDVRATNVAQTNDTGATTTTIYNKTNTTTLAAPALMTATSGNYIRSILTLVLHSRSRPETVTVTAYLAVDARAASNGCTVQGTATLGI